MIRVVQTYYMDFLRRVKDYGVITYSLPDVSSDDNGEEENSQAVAVRPGPPNLAKMNAEREQKLAR